MLEVNTDAKAKVYDITDQVVKEVFKAGVSEGICVITIPHVSAGLIIAENEPGLLEDYLTALDVITPTLDYLHNKIETNAKAHIQAALLGSNQTILIREEKLSLGRWQKILFVELDGPRKRNVDIMILGK